MIETTLIIAMLERLEQENDSRFDFHHTIKKSSSVIHYISVIQMPEAKLEINANGENFNQAYRILAKKLNDLKLIENWSLFMLHNLTTN